METCDFCGNEAVYKARAAMGPSLYCCPKCVDVGPMYTLEKIKPKEN